MLTDVQIKQNEQIALALLNSDSKSDINSPM